MECDQDLQLKAPVRDARRYAPFIDSSRINNTPMTNQSMILISTVKIYLQVYSSSTDTNKAHAWWNAAQSLRGLCVVAVSHFFHTMREF